MAAGSKNFQKNEGHHLIQREKLSKIEVLLKICVLAAILNPRWPPEVKIFKNGGHHSIQHEKLSKIEVLLKICVLAAILNPRWPPEVKIFN